MDGMRWLLLLIGLLVIGCVFLYSRRTPKPEEMDGRSVCVVSLRSTQTGRWAPHRNPPMR